MQPKIRCNPDRYNQMSLYMYICSHSYKDWTSMWVVFFGIFLLGIATSFFYSFGLPYVDDNSEKEDSPLLLSLVKKIIKLDCLGRNEGTDEL